METRLIDSFEQFLGLRQAWNELSVQTPDDHAFMRHEWFEHWLISQDMTDRLQMIGVWRDGQLVGVLPLVWRDVTLRGLRFKALRFAESPVSPRCNALVLSADVLAPLVAGLTSRRDYQLLELQHLESESPTTQMLLDHLRHRSPLLVSVTPGRQSPYLMLECSWEEYLKKVSHNRRHWMRRINKRLRQKEYDLEVRHLAHESEATFLEDVLIQVSSRAWKAKEGTAIGQVRSQERLYKTFTRVGLRNGLVEAWVLLVNERPVACDYYLTCGDRYVGIRSDFDTTFREYSPSEFLRISYIKGLCQRGQPVEIDFGGAKVDYKVRWANHIRPHSVIHAARPISKGAMVSAWKIARSLLSSS